MRNPWTKLPRRPPYVLKDDLPAINAHNKKGKRDFAYQDWMFPEPFFGNHRAKIVILNLNPGFAVGKDRSAHLHNQRFRTLLKLNLRKRHDGYPFLFLDPSISDTPGYQWWMRRLKTLVDVFGARKIARNLLCLEYFPYHSKNFKGGAIVPSQLYNFHLLKKALKRKATVICFRGFERWAKAVPELRAYKHVYRLNNSRSVYLTERNCPKGYKKVVRQLNR